MIEALGTRGQRAAAMYSLIVTAKMNGYRPAGYASGQDRRFG
jgi:hypothetical protein